MQTTTLVLNKCSAIVSQLRSFFNYCILSDAKNNIMISALYMGHWPLCSLNIGSSRGHWKTCISQPQVQTIMTKQTNIQAFPCHVTTCLTKYPLSNIQYVKLGKLKLKCCFHVDFIIDHSAYLDVISHQTNWMIFCPCADQPLTKVVPGVHATCHLNPLTSVNMRPQKASLILTHTKEQNSNQDWQFMCSLSCLYKTFLSLCILYHFYHFYAP